MRFLLSNIYDCTGTGLSEDFQVLSRHCRDRRHRHPKTLRVLSVFVALSIVATYTFILMY